MKTILLTAALLCAMQFGNAQFLHFAFNPDSIPNASDPGQAYIRFLYQTLNLYPSNEIEQDNQLQKDYEFWAERIPYGVSDPKRKYAMATKGLFNTGSCNNKLAAGTFNGNWQNIGPKSELMIQGVALDVWVDPDDVDHIIACFENSGLWKTRDGGQHWNCVSDVFLSSGTIGASKIAVNPFDNDEMYLATYLEGIGGHRDYVNAWRYGQGVWHSVDRGDTWTLELNGDVDAFTAFKEIEFAPFKILNNTKTIVFATYQNDLYKKIEGGAWEKVTPSPSNDWMKALRTLTFNTDVPGKLYVGTYNSWAPATNPAFVLEIEYDDFGNIITNIITTSQILGNLNFGFPLFFVPALTFETSYHAGKLYIMASSDPGIYTSFQYSYFVLIEYDLITGAYSQICNSFSAFNQNDQMMKFLFSPSDPNVIYVANTVPQRVVKQPNGVWTVTDLTNYAITADIHPDIRDFHFVSSSLNPLNRGADDVIVWATDGGITKSVGNTFDGINGDLIAAEVYDAGVSTGGEKKAAGTFHTGILATNSSGTWNLIQAADAYDAIYDKRTDHNNQTLLSHDDGGWYKSNHNNVNLLGLQPFTGNMPNYVTSIDNPRPFLYPWQFRGDKMYSGNKNMFESQPNAYDPWANQTSTGDLASNSAKMNNCKTFSIAGPERQYYGIRRRFGDETDNPPVVFSVVDNPQIVLSSIQISDLAGKPIYQSNFDSELKQHIWDTRNISNGNYIYTLVDMSGMKYSGKVTIRHNQ
jgi:hypothetical protein